MDQEKQNVEKNIKNEQSFIKRRKILLLVIELQS